MGESEVGESTSSRSWLERVAQVFTAEPSSRAELIEIIRDAGERAILDAEALGIIDGAMAVSEMQARDIMIPRAQVVFVRADASPDAFLPVVVESQHSRFPVIGEDFDDVRGVLHAKDLLPLALSRNLENFRLKDHIRQAPIIPESKRLNVLLTEFRENRNHMAIVVDEYGSVAGVVTIEDVLEQIVGEIEDEHDVNDDSFIKQLDDDAWTVKAMTPIEDFNELFDTDWPDEEFDTIGGIVMQRFGHLPKREETIAIDGFRFRVLNADSRRIRLLHMTRLPATDDEQD
ncbi:MAG: transporter associated domain-containing protein [Pseudomonadales bacterium]|jgi:magnesium and cobalt transporter|nr:transporter associated domain-containing protein [Pseudomonadales bacterium]